MQLQSEAINELIGALAKAQGEMGLAIKDGVNPHFNSHFATLGACILASKAVLSKNALAVIQSPITHDGKLFLITTLAHASGQWIRSETPVLSEKPTAQSMGSGLSYARRYALNAIIGLSDKDDDGSEASTENHEQGPGPAQAPAKAPSDMSHEGLGAYVLKMGRDKGRPLSEIGVIGVSNYLKWLKSADAKIRGSYSGKADLQACEAFLRAPSPPKKREVKEEGPGLAFDLPPLESFDEELPF